MRKPFKINIPMIIPMPLPSPACIAGIALRIFSAGQSHHFSYIILIGGFIHSDQVFR